MHKEDFVAAFIISTSQVLRHLLVYNIINMNLTQTTTLFQLNLPIKGISGVFDSLATVILNCIRLYLEAPQFNFGKIEAVFFIPYTITKTLHLGKCSSNKKLNSISTWRKVILLSMPNSPCVIIYEPATQTRTPKM